MLSDRESEEIARGRHEGLGGHILLKWGGPAPKLPDSGVPYVSDLPTDGRVTIRDGTVSDVRIGGHSTGLTSGMFLVAPGESITVVYSSPPNWDWFLN